MQASVTVEIGVGSQEVDLRLWECVCPICGGNLALGDPSWFVWRDQPNRVLQEAFCSRGCVAQWVADLEREGAPAGMTGAVQ